MSGGWWVGVSQAHREASGLKGGDEVQVTLELDTAPREIEVPPELAAALEADPVAKAFFDGLSYSNKSVFTLNVAGTKNPETEGAPRGPGDREDARGPRSLAIPSPATPDSRSSASCTARGRAAPGPRRAA